jgi:AcrR family transcriptional regulator
MTTVTNRSIPRDALRRKVAEAAIAAFRIHGYEAATLDEITRGAGVAKGTFFNFFPTKAHVLLEHGWGLVDRFAELREAMDPLTPRLSLMDFFAAAEALLLQEGELAAALHREVWSRPELSGAEAEEAAYADFFRSAQSVGAVSGSVEPEVAAASVSDLWAASVRRWIAGGRQGSLSEDLAAKLDLLFAGLSPHGG